MQLFLFLNDLAGRWPILDALMRGVYVATIPVLAIVLLGLVTLVPRGNRSPSRGKIALATLLALGGAALLAWGIESWAQSLNVGTLSPRPFMTRWVNLLIVEPQDNSFPCIEITVAAILSVAIWTANRRFGVAAALATLLLITARLFCGSNYFADVSVGALLGVGLMWLCLALLGAPREKKSRIGMASVGAFTLGATALGTFIVMAAMPRFAGKLQVPWGLLSPTSATIKANATRAARGTLQEGEGIPTLSMTESGTISADEYAGEAEAQALSKRATQFLPQTEAYLMRILTPRALPFVLIDVEVAPVNFKESSYRAGALRFEIDPTIPNVRQLVAQRAATLVKSAFAADPKLDNVDISGVVTGNSAQSGGNLMRFAGDEVPVFTASVQRRNLTVKAPKWANDPALEGGLWLRTRSRLWINDQVLPRVSKPKTVATPKSATMPATTPTPVITPTPKSATMPTITPTPKSARTPTPNVKPTIGQTPTARPTRTPTVKPTIRPTVRPAIRPTAKPAPTRTPKPRPIIQSV